MQTLRDIQNLLAAHGLRPKKRFGQNFLHDHHHLARILEAAEVSQGDLVVEVGPGTGTLSELLLQAGAKLIAVEVDRDLEPILWQRLGDAAKLIFDDVLAGKHALSPMLLEAVGDRPFKLIANLPYQVASPLLVNLLLQTWMTAAVVMVQREVAERIMATPGGKDYGPLSVMVQATCNVRRVGVLTPTCFWPAPKIESAVIRLDRLDQPYSRDLRALSQLLHTLFSKRRKQLGAILGRDRAWPAGIDPSNRPEQLTVEQLCLLTRGDSD
ncbi:MAG: ribosomal RNA small subunit methyltransferase A [Phycisphaeraceae bacterium]|nr:ribosomal RNA small subunit methyltransferase A [Phycisphaeraceae bacterium]